MEKEIFKVQKSLTDSRDNLLIYNKDESICVLYPQAEEIIDLFQDENKIYIEAVYDKYREKFTEISKVLSADF